MNLQKLADRLRSLGAPTIYVHRWPWAPPEEKPAAYSVAQAAAELGVSKETVYREVSEGLMPHSKVRGRITITAEQLAKYRERREAKLPPGQFRHL
jgi:excisionase family DNA binding protein